MDHAIIFDCEFLTRAGAPSRFWCGPLDPDPVIAQIGAVKLALTAPFKIIDTLRVFVTPRDRTGAAYALDPLFTKITGISEAVLAAQGLPLNDALAKLADFAGTARLWSWGKDEFNMVAISCYVEGIAPPIPVTRFDNACKLFLKAGMPLGDLHEMRSNRLAGYYDIDHPPLHGHDALDDALSVAYATQHVLLSGKLKPSDFG
ncbi:MAG: exonuclease [Deltaproteobacteria bacterium]